MSLAELVFVGLALWTATRLLTIAWQLIGWELRRGLRTAVRLGLLLGAYVAALMLTSVLRPPPTVAIGQRRCFDDWCLTVTSATRAPLGASRERVRVAFSMSSRAKQRPQGERGTVSYLLAADGRRFDAEPDVTQPDFSTLLAPGESRATTRTFDVPAGLDLGVAYAHEGGFPIEWLILGGGGWFARPDMAKVPR